jgi:hypothetical protein
MKIRIPKGPIRPVLEALDDNEILHGFITSMEDSAVHQIRKLKEADSRQVFEDRLIHTIHGLDGESWHLESLFSDYFPALQRSAAFLVAWAIFEHHLEDLCQEIATAMALKIALADLRDTGARRVRAYLAKAACLHGQWADKLWQELASLQLLRNLFAHGDGSLTDNRQKERAYALKSPYITVHENSVRLEVGFMPHVLKAQRDFLLRGCLGRVFSGPTVRALAVSWLF